MQLGTVHLISTDIANACCDVTIYGVISHHNVLSLVYSLLSHSTAFVESMRALGYPRLISMESFRTPNFRLVADALFWLATRYDGTAEVPDDIDSEDARVEFLKAVAQTMYAKARIKLNMKQLYRADGFAVKELLKISSVLYEAMLSGTATADGDSVSGSSSSSSSASSSSSSLPGDLKASTGIISSTQASQILEDLRGARDKSREAVDCGEKLTEALMEEEAVRPARDQALAFLNVITKNADGGAISSSTSSLGGGSADPSRVIHREIAEQLDVLKEAVADLQRNVDVLTKEEQTLVQKVQQKDSEYDRQSRRVASLRKVRPAFMDEYDNVEAELKQVYTAYIERFRNLQYLEAELAKVAEAEEEKKNESDRALKRMQQKMRVAEIRVLRGEEFGGSVGGPLDDDGDDDDDDEANDGVDDDDDDGNSDMGQSLGGTGRLGSSLRSSGSNQFDHSTGTQQHQRPGAAFRRNNPGSVSGSGPSGLSSSTSLSSSSSAKSSSGLGTSTGRAGAGLGARNVTGSMLADNDDDDDDDDDLDDDDEGGDRGGAGAGAGRLGNSGLVVTGSRVAGMPGGVASRFAAASSSSSSLASASGSSASSLSSSRPVAAPAGNRNGRGGVMSNRRSSLNDDDHDDDDDLSENDLGEADF